MITPSETVLVTGGAGFLGSHLCERLIADGARVIALDDLSTGRRENVAEVARDGRFELVEGSALDGALVGELVERADSIVHLAAAVGVRRIVERPVDTIVTNVEATRVVLEAAATHGAPILFASTSEVYGKSDAVPFREDADVSLGATTRSRWSYACSKALDEWLAFAYRAERGVDLRVCRFFNVVGPRQTGRYGMVLPSLVRQALAEEPLTVYGDGEQTRAFAHVADVVDAVVRLRANPAAEGQVVNVGSAEETSIRALAERVRDAAGSRSKIVLVPYAEAYAEGFEDMRRRVPDTTKLRELTGLSLAGGLERAIRDVVSERRDARAVG